MSTPAEAPAFDVGDPGNRQAAGDALMGLIKWVDYHAVERFGRRPTTPRWGHRRLITLLDGERVRPAYTLDIAVGSLIAPPKEGLVEEPLPPLVSGTLATITGGLIASPYKAEYEITLRLLAPRDFSAPRDETHGILRVRETLQEGGHDANSHNLPNSYQPHDHTVTSLAGLEDVVAAMRHALSGPLDLDWAAERVAGGPQTAGEAIRAALAQQTTPS